jgi:hypothetical protein
MGSISRGIILTDIAKTELVEAGMPRNASFYARDGEKHRPREDPDREKENGHSAEETNEKVGIETVDFGYVVVVRTVYSERPSKERGRDRFDPLPRMK